MHDGDGTAVVMVPVSVIGSNDHGSISREAGGAVTEAGGVHDAMADSPTTSGPLAVTEVDTGKEVFQELDAPSLKGVCSDFTFDPETGVWSYTIDNDRPTPRPDEGRGVGGMAQPQVRSSTANQFSWQSFFISAPS